MLHPLQRYIDQNYAPKMGEKWRVLRLIGNEFVTVTVSFFIYIYYCLNNILYYKDKDCNCYIFVTRGK